MKMYLLPEDLRAGLMAYLKTQPYGAVADGMRALETLEPAEEARPDLKPVVDVKR